MRRTIRRGQPVIGLALLLVSWVGVRAALLESDGYSVQAEPVQADAVAGIAHRDGLSASQTPAPSLPTKRSAEIAPPQASAPANMVPQAPLMPGGSSLAPIAPPVPQVTPIAPPSPAVLGPGVLDRQRLAAGHQLLYLAALSQLPLPPEALAARPQPTPAPPQTAAANWNERRFSGDAWLLLRRGGTGAGTGGPIPASYGASQAGAVIRFSLAPASPLRPALYLRATSAVRAPHDEELAAGLAFRPVKGLPVRAMAELRATRLQSGTALRPAILLVSEFPPLPLPGGFRAETYGAAGYVGGRFATPFAEGQFRLDRRIARFGPAELRAGAGAWGGAQRGASRLDAGPGATLGFPVGPGNARISADWRFRLAGKAAPTSGPAVTLSAGF